MPCKAAGMRAKTRLSLLLLLVMMLMLMLMSTGCGAVEALEQSVDDDDDDTSDNNNDVEADDLSKRARPSTKRPAWLETVQQCGHSKYSNLQKRIVGGVESRPHEWPWLVSFQLRRQNRMQADHLCGGTLITRQFILTSAHCFERKWHNALTTDPNMWLARLGEHNLRAPDRTEKQPEIEKIIIHKDRDPSKSLNFDIALVKLKCPVNLTREINIACLPERNDSLQTGNNCVTIGWGTTTAIDRKSMPKLTHMDKVRHVEVPLVDKDRCRESYASVIRRRHIDINISEETICASNMDGTVRDACQFDSGGPLMCSEGVVDGIVSFGHGCGRHGFPGIYTNVSAHLDWINGIITSEYHRCIRSSRRNCSCY